MIFYTDFLIPDIYAAYTRGPLIFIRPEFKKDVGLLEHEKVHRRQWFRTLGLHPLLYRLSKKYRLKSEVEAYREQMKHYPDDKSTLFSHYLSTNYDLDLTEQDALELLK